MVDNPHDRLFKVTLSQPGAASAYLRSVLPAALCAALDFEHMEAQPTDLVGTRLQELFADVVYKIPLEGESAYVCALLEHQSTPEPMMPLRFMNAMASIWEDVLRAEPERRRVPAIIPVLVHNGVAPWRSPVRLSALYDLPAAVLDMLRPNLPEFEYVLDDLRVQDEEVVEARISDPILRIALLCLRARGEAPAASRFAAWLEYYRALCRTGNRGAREVIFWYDMGVSGGERSVLLEAAMAAEPELKETYVTMYERILREGIEKGIEQGISKGEATMLEKLLRLKFGELPADIRTRLETAKAPELERWGERILSANALGDVFAEDERR